MLNIQTDDKLYLCCDSQINVINKVNNRAKNACLRNSQNVKKQKKKAAINYPFKRSLSLVKTPKSSINYQPHKGFWEILTSYIIHPLAIDNKYIKSFWSSSQIKKIFASHTSSIAACVIPKNFSIGYLTLFSSQHNQLSQIFICCLNFWQAHILYLCKLTITFLDFICLKSHEIKLENCNIDQYRYLTNSSCPT